jgi:hypothetical protein
MTLVGAALLARAGSRLDDGLSLHTGPYAGQRKKPFSEARIGVPSHG